MTLYIVRRLLQSMLVILIMLVLVFVGVYVIGNPVDVLVSTEADQEEFERMVRILGLDQPLWKQILIYVTNLVQGDFGRSFAFSQPALKLVVQRMPATVELVFVAMVMALATGIPLGMYTGLRPDTATARFIMGTSIIGVSIPNFWQGLMLIFVLAVTWGLLPSGGRGDLDTVLGIRSSLWTLDGWSHVLLPAVNLALFQCTLVIRLVRANVREIVLLDYIRFARAKGLAWRRIVFVHILKSTQVVLITGGGVHQSSELDIIAGYDEVENMLSSIPMVVGADTDVFILGAADFSGVPEAPPIDFTEAVATLWQAACLQWELRSCHLADTTDVLSREEV